MSYPKLLQQVVGMTFGLLLLVGAGVSEITPTATPTPKPPTVTPTQASTPVTTSPGTSAENMQDVKDEAWQISVPPDWMRTESVPQGFAVGFRQELAGGQYATLYFTYEVMPPEMGDPPSDTSDMQSQWDAMLENQYPDIRSVDGAVPQVNGRILVNGTYELTDGGEKVRRRYTYFLSDRTAFVVECSAPPTEWANVLTDFDAMLLSLRPAGSSPQAETESDESAKAQLLRDLPTLLGSFPSQWRISLNNVTIIPGSSTDNRTLEITLSFDRPDIGEIYETTKTVFGIVTAGGTESDLNSLPAQTQRAASNIGDFIYYLGEVWGLASGYVANCNPAIERYKLLILDSEGQTVGSVSISSEDASAILTGEVTASAMQRIFAMYVLE